MSQVDARLPGLSMGELAQRVRSEGVSILKEVYGDDPILLLAGTSRDASRGGMGLRTNEGKVISPYSAIPSGRGQAVALRKSERNPFAGVITLGRARNNDIIVKAPGVSKLHAMFRETDGGWTVEDRESSYGTRFNGKPLEAKSPRTIKVGDELTFGGEGCLFIDAETLLSLTQMVRKTS